MRYKPLPIRFTLHYITVSTAYARYAPKIKYPTVTFFQNLKTLTSQQHREMKRRVGSSEEEEEENEELERDVKQMAEKLLQYRTTLPDHLRSTFSSVLTAQRPVLPPPSESTLSGAPIPGTISHF